MKFVADVGTPEIPAKLFGTGKDKVIYLVAFPLLKIFDEIETCPDFDCSLIIFYVNNWFRDLSPWPAPGVMPQDPPFEGQAAEFMEKILEIGKKAEEDYGITAEKRYVAGHSMGGLFAIWAACTVPGFNGFASMSGSVWYDDLFDYMEKSDLLGDMDKGYFSVGDIEHETPVERFHDFLPKSVKAKRICDSRGVKETTFVLEKGDHADGVTERTVHAIQWLVQ